MRQIQFLRLGEEYDVQIISSDNQQYLKITRYANSGEVFRDGASGTYPNARMLSEALRDAIGYGPALDLLKKEGVDENDPLMYLGKNV